MRPNRSHLSSRKMRLCARWRLKSGHTRRRRNFSADALALRSVVVQLGAELCAVAQHNLSARFIPGAAIVLPGAPAPYLLSITNVGSQAGSVALNLTTSPSLSGSWATQTATLAAGETLSVPTVITATQLGTYLFQAELTVQEAPTVQMTVPASLSAVDALLKVSRMTATPAFVEYGTGNRSGGSWPISPTLPICR